MKVMTMVNKLRPWELDILYDILEAKAVVVCINGELYALSGRWRFRKLKEQVDYSTTLTACTCPDSKYRGHVCKHSLFLQNFLAVAADPAEQDKL